MPLHHYAHEEIHITPFLLQLHWVPVHLRPTYSVLLFTYCVLRRLEPVYLSELITYRLINVTHRSASQRCLLFVPASQTVTHGDHRVPFCSAVLWNRLDSHNSARQSHGVDCIAMLYTTITPVLHFLSITIT